jgi:hypothetical protein
MHTYRRAVLVAVLLALTSTLSANPSAQQNPQLRGTWALNRTASDDVNVVIETAVAPMNVVVRQVFRPRLRSMNAAAPQVVISFDAQNVRIDEQGRPSATIPANGSPVLWHWDTGMTCPQVRGDCVRLSTAFQNDQLELRLQAEDLSQVKRFAVSPDGNTLTMEVTVTSPRLPQLMSYKLVFNRTN